VTAHLRHLKEDFAAFNEAYLEFVQEPYPVRTTVGSQLYDILVEIDVVAVLRADEAPAR
jgi:2-iminobutanoate/2-iminopropanoate deaminase